MSETIRFKADRALESDLNQATSYEDVRSLLESASVRSGIGHRDPSTGRFVAVETDSQRAAAPVTPAEDKHVIKDVEINGAQLTFEGTPLEVEQAIRQAYEVAEALRSAAPALPVVPREARNTSFDHPVTQYLAEQGFDVNQAAQEQLEKSWAAATQEFLSSEVGAGWPGGNKNMELIGLKIVELGLENAPDKVAALSQAYSEMREKGLLFEGDVSPEQLTELTEKATPQEVLEAWKESQGSDPEVANQAFIQTFSHGRSSSGLFGR